MSLWYLRSGGATGCNWNTALANTTTIYTTLAALITAIGSPAGGDTVVIAVADDHQETLGASTTWLLPSSPVGITQLLSCDHTYTGNPTSALLTQTTGYLKTTTSTFQLIFQGNFYALGLVISTGNNTNFVAADTNLQKWENCSFTITGAGADRFLYGVSTASQTAEARMRNCTFAFGNAQQSHVLRNARVDFVNCVMASTGGTPPTNIFANGNNGGFVTCRGCDLTGAASTGAVVGDYDCPDVFYLLDCIMPSNGAGVNGSLSAAHPRVDTFRSDSAGTNYRCERYYGEGTHTVDTTHTHTGGAQVGSTPVAWAITTGTLVSWPIPFDCQPIAVPATAASHTITLYLLGPSGLHNDDIWIEMEYQGSSGNAQASFNASTTKSSVVAANAALPTDPAGTSAWASTTGITGPTAYKITSGSFTVGQAGDVLVTVRMAAQSKTIYVDPLVVLT